MRPPCTLHEPCTHLPRTPRAPSTHLACTFDQVMDAWKPWLRRGTAPSAQASGARPSGEAGAAGATDTAGAAGAAGAAGTEASVEFVVDDFKTSLPSLLRRFEPSRVGVVACHACTHLTDAIVAMSIDAGVDFAVMPCCQRDLLTNGQMALAAKSLRVREAEVIPRQQPSPLRHHPLLEDPDAHPSASASASASPRHLTFP